MNPNSQKAEHIENELHDLGEKIELLADQLKGQGFAQTEELRNLGSEIARFYEQFWASMTAQEMSSSTVNTSQASE